MLRKRIPSVEQILVVYPYAVEGGFTVVSKTPATGLYDAHFGLIMNTTTPCHEGYIKATPSALPQQRSDIPMDTDARCTEPATKSNSRGSQNAPPRAPANYDSPVVASYDPMTQKLTWGAPSTADVGRYRGSSITRRGVVEVAVPPAPDGALADATTDSATPTAPRSSLRSRFALLVALVLVIVGCLVSLGVLLITEDDAADDSQQLGSRRPSARS